VICQRTAIKENEEEWGDMHVFLSGWKYSSRVLLKDIIFHMFQFIEIMKSSSFLLKYLLKHYSLKTKVGV
jgi:hypothetical protein